MTTNGATVELDVPAFARRLGVHPRTAYRRLEALRARQDDPDVLRVVKRPVAIGSGARREAWRVCWPLVASNDDAVANDDCND